MSYCICNEEQIRFLNNYPNLLPLINNTIQTALKQGRDIEASGSKNYSVAVPVNNNSELGNIIFTSREHFDEGSILGKELSTNALQRKNWDKTIQYYAVVVSWRITNRGTFMYGHKKPRGPAIVDTVSATIDCDSMAPYNCVAHKTIQRIDPSVVQIQGRADYTNLIGRLAGHTDHGYLDVEINGTGNVRVTRASFNNWAPTSWGI